MRDIKRRSWRIQVQEILEIDLELSNTELVSGVMAAVPRQRKDEAPTQRLREIQIHSEVVE